MQSIIISNYKNLRHLDLNSLSRVNLIVGNNNVGKSTLLEAIMIYASEGSISALLDVLQVRGELYTPGGAGIDADRQMESFCSLISDRNIALFTNSGIEISTNDSDGIRSLKLRLVAYVESQKDNINQGVRRKILERNFSVSEYPDAVYGLLVESSYSNGSSREVLHSFEHRLRSVPPLQPLPPVQYVKTNQLARTENAVLFDKIALTALEPEIIRALNIIEPGIDAINFLMDEYSPEQQRVPLIVFKGNNKKIRLSTMGDGINRVLTIILALLNAKDGYLLIDEFDNGLHYSVQTQLWKIVYELSRKLNVHVFATTHSSDCIKSFVDADSENSGKLLRLEEAETDIIAIPFNDQD